MRHPIRLLTLFPLVLAACTSTQQQPESKWNVKAKTSTDARVWVRKSDGSRQCEGAGKITPKSAANELAKAGVMVYLARAGSDGRMYTSVCGAPTGKTVDLEISGNDIQKATALGFQPITVQ